MSPFVYEKQKKYFIHEDLADSVENNPGVHYNEAAME